MTLSKQVLLAINNAQAGIGRYAHLGDGDLSAWREGQAVSTRALPSKLELIAAEQLALDARIAVAKAALAAGDVTGVFHMQKENEARMPKARRILARFYGNQHG